MIDVLNLLGLIVSIPTGLLLLLGVIFALNEAQSDTREFFNLILPFFLISLVMLLI